MVFIPPAHLIEGESRYRIIFPPSTFEFENASLFCVASCVAVGDSSTLLVNNDS